MVLYGYTLLGIIFAIYFVRGGVDLIDNVAQNARLGFRFVIFPGSVMLWPYLLWRCVKHPDMIEENSAHRRKARL